MEWAAYRVVSLLLPCEDEQWIRMQLLRDPDWFRGHQPEVGGTIYLDMGEMGVEGDAIVEAIEPCPEIEPGEGRVVTATFHHSIGECLELDIEGEDEPLRVTAGHPIWRVDRSDVSEDFADSTDCCGDPSGCGCDVSGAAREIIESLPELQEFQSQIVSLLESVTATIESPVAMLNLHPNWIPARHLQPGDTVSTVNGDAEISTVRMDHIPCAVFNIEVQGDHVYRVTSSAILAHNDSGCRYKIIYANPTNPKCRDYRNGRGGDGVMIDFDILKIEIPGLSYEEEQDALAELEGKQLTEAVTSDGGCLGGTDVRTGRGCTISANGITPGCRDLYGICASPAERFPLGICTETFTQKLFVAGQHAETWRIVFKISRGPNGVSGTVTREQIE